MACHIAPTARLELLLFSEEHGETYDGAVDEQTADNAHNHCLDANLFRVRQDYWQSCEKVVLANNCPRTENVAPFLSHPSLPCIFPTHHPRTQYSHDTPKNRTRTYQFP